MKLIQLDLAVPSSIDECGLLTQQFISTMFIIMIHTKM